MKQKANYFGAHADAVVWRAAASAALWFATIATLSGQERVLGTDISYWNSAISQANWDTVFSTGNRKFVQLRATRGGTTGVDETAGRPDNTGLQTLSQRYDDPRFVQNLKRATTAGLIVGPYHFGRPDVSGNTGTDEADHMLQMAGAWMRPGYMMPMYDCEAGQSLGGDTLAQFAIDFSSRIYAVMQIRPCIYINGSYSGTLQGATQARRDALAKPATYTPSVVGPAYPMLWDAYYTTTLDIQTANPKDGYSGFYGPWDDYGTSHPWTFWQHSSTVAIPGMPDTTCDSDVSHGDIEYIRNYLIPAVWWNESSGDWSALTNWNSGQTPVAPVTPPDQYPPYETGGLPTPRLPGAAGGGPTSGQYDTVILERPNTNITVTLSAGTHNVRKLYVRETLNLTGGSLTVNYDPTYRADNSSTVLHGGPISAQFSGPVTLSGSGSLTVHTLQVDTSHTFTLAGGTLTLNTINLMPHASVPAKILMNGDATFNARSNATAVIKKGAGSGNTGFIDLNGGARAFNVGNGTSDVDLSLDVPVTNGGLGKTGAGTMRLTAANTYAGGTTVSAGRLLVNNTSGSGTGTGGVTVNGGVLGGSGAIAGTVTVNSGGTASPGTSIGTLTLNSAPVFSGTNFMEIDRNGGAPLADKIVLTSGTLTYGGTLVVTNVGAALVGGEVFTLFNAPGYTGAFAATSLPALSPGLSWFLDDLTVDGAIKVISLTAPTINSGPSNVTVVSGQNATFSVSAAGTQPLAYQWRFNTTNLAGATASSYTRSNAQPADAGSYSVVVTNAAGSVTSAPAVLTVHVAPTITEQPRSQIVRVGSNVTFTVTASGIPAPTYQWRFNGTNIAGATGTAHTQPSVQLTDAGTYSVLVSNLVAAVPSDDAVLTVTSPPPPRIDAIAILTDGRAWLQVSGGPGDFGIEVTPALSGWTQLSSLNATGTVFEYIDPETNQPARFYRVRVLP